MQLADKLVVKPEMAKADWECWTKLEKKFEQIHGPILFDTDDNNQDDACQDEMIEQKWNMELLQHAKEVDVCCLTPHLPPTNSSGPAPRPLLKGNGVRQGQKDREICKLQCGKW